jgi:guanyl-specific ribonuclease Sa
MVQRFPKPQAKEHVMRRHLRNPWIWVAAAILFAVWLFWPRTVESPTQGETTGSLSAPASTSALLHEVPVSTPAIPGKAPVSTLADLPPEALDTIQRIVNGGPFPHRQDGKAFGNREGRLPARPQGYYREYTVATPGRSNRGARRIVTGGQPPEVWYYTDDHYDSFRSFTVDAHGGSIGSVQ